MNDTIPSTTLEKFTTFGDLLRYLRRRTGLTQTELSIAVGYSTAQISRLEQNLRPPDLPTIQARFVEALGLEREPEAVARLLDLAANVRREDAPAAGLCPYKGLSYFDEADADLFVGREALTSRLLGRVLELASGNQQGQGRFLAIVGASGSGKSSLVRAGLVPAIHWNKASADWQIQVLTPTARPLESLAESLAPETDSVAATAAIIDDLAREPRSLHLHAKRQLKTGRGSHVVLVIDQFEELFALCRSEDERTAFIDNLLTAASETDGPTVAVIAMRADFYAHCAAYPQLREALAGQQEYIGAMDAAELRRAIEEPAERGHWEFEPGLVDQLLHDVGQEPGALPLLSHALLETWGRRRGHTMTLSGYASSGGVRGAIAETAESVFTDQFSHEQQGIARRIFLRLTELGDETSTGDTRRRATFTELVLRPEEMDTTRAVLTALADARLITISEDAAEVAHEALIREWPTLRSWLEDNREGLRLHRQLTEASQEWDRSGRDPDTLYRGARLAQAREWGEAHEVDLNALERDFLTASVDSSRREAHEREAQIQRELDAAQKLAETEKHSAERLRRRAYLLGGAFALALLLASVAVYFGNSANRNAAAAHDSALSAEQNAAAAQHAEATAQAERDRADEAARSAQSRELAVQSKLNLDQDSELSILLALQAYQTANSKEALDALHEAVLNSRLIATLPAHQGGVTGISFSPDGTHFASSSADGTVRLWETRTGRQVFSLAGGGGSLWAISYSPDGTLLAGGGDSGTVRIWDAATGTEKLRLDIGATIWSLAFGPDGTWLVTGAQEGKVRFWDTRTGTELFALSSPDWTTADAPLAVNSIALSGDGSRLAIALLGDKGCQIEIWDVAVRARLSTLFQGWSYCPTYFANLALSPDGKRLAVSRTGNTDTPASVWDVDTARKLYDLDAVANRTSFSRDDRLLFTATVGGKANVWDATTGGRLLTLGHKPSVHAIAANWDCIDQEATWCETRLVTGASDGTIKVWDITPAGRGEGLGLPGAYFTLNHDWSRLTTLADSKDEKGNLTTALRTWTIPTPSLQGFEEISKPSSVTSTNLPQQDAGLPGTRYRTNVAQDRTIQIWDLLSPGNLPRSVCCFAQSGGVKPSLTAVSADGSRLVVAGTNNIMQIWDLTTGQRLKPLSVTSPAEIGTIVLSPDGTRLAAVGKEGATIWDLKAGGQLLTLAADLGATGTSIAFSPDGKLVVAGTCEPSIMVWDAESGEVKHKLVGDTGCVYGAAVSLDGTLLASSSADLTTRVWDLTNGTEILTLPGLGATFAFSPDNRFLLAGVSSMGRAVDTDTRLILINPDDLVALAKSRLTRSFTTEECQKYLRMDACPAEP